MAYCTSTDVLDRAPAVAADANATAQVADGIAAAQAIIDGHLQTKYIVPFADPVPALITVVAKTLAAAWVLQNVFSGSQSTEQQQYALALEKSGTVMLDRLRDGTMVLTDATTHKATPSSQPPIAITCRPDNQLRRFDVLGLCGPKRPGHPNFGSLGTGFGVSE